MALLPLDCVRVMGRPSPSEPDPWQVKAIQAPGGFFAPRAAWYDGTRLYVADTGHHRVLVWHGFPAQDGEPPHLVLGQRDMAGDQPNAGGTPGPDTLYMPVGLWSDGTRLVVADAWNHRVLIWLQPPVCNGQPADLVLGQPDFRQVQPNRGGSVGPDTLHWPFGIASDGRRLVVADTGNRRVLIWHTFPTANGEPAHQVLGQRDFASHSENAGGRPGLLGMRWPHACALAGDRLAVADAGNHRVLLWPHLPVENGVPAAAVLGQPHPDSTMDNAGGQPGAHTLRFPYGVAAAGSQVWVADTGNSRLLLWDNPWEAAATGQMGTPASGVWGQPDFASNGENRWLAMGPDTLNWPFSVQVCDGGLVLVADTGNHRVLALRPSPHGGRGEGELPATGQRRYLRMWPQSMPVVS